MPINHALADKMGLSLDVRNKIENTHEFLDYVLNNPSEFNEPVAIVEFTEYFLQQLWGFKQDRNFHTHWWRIKGCTCPSLDNLDRVDTGQRVINATCPWHKGEVNE